MCNAHNHSPGCNCGFGGEGQRYGKISLRSSTNWAQTAVKEPWLVRRGLQDLNWDERGVKEFMREYKKLLAQDLGDQTLATRLREMLGWRTIKVEEQWKETLDIPLYRFSAPRAPEAVVTYDETLGRTWVKGWGVKVFGVGTGSSADMRVDVNFSFAAVNGQCMVVAVPVPIRVERVVVLDGRRVVGHGTRAEVDLPASKQERFLAKRVCTPAAPEDCGAHADDPTEGTIEARLASTAPSVVQRVAKMWRSGEESEVWLALKRVVEVGPTVRVARLRELTLTCTLPGGFDYRGNLCRGRLWWEPPRQSSQRSTAKGRRMGRLDP